MSAPSPSPAQVPVPAPLRLPWDLRLTPGQFEQVCRANPDAVLELAADGHLIAMTPTGGEASVRNSALLIELGLALKRAGLAAKIFDSSGGFALPDGSVLTPDAALVRLDRWERLSPQQRRGFPPLCPDLVVELASASDEGARRLGDLREKMERYRANGAQLGWLLLPEERVVEVWRWGHDVPEQIKNAKRLDAGELFPGLELELAEIWGV